MEAVSITTDPQEARTSPIDPATGMQATYLVLSEEERGRGFVRPVRSSYRHVGMRPVHPLRDLTPEEHARYDDVGYVKYEIYQLEAFTDDQRSSVLGRFWTQAQLDSGCGGVTTMGDAIAETYARTPTFYGATYCATCRGHFPVGEHGEFEWLDGTKVGT